MYKWPRLLLEFNENHNHENCIIYTSEEALNLLHATEDSTK